MARRAVPFDTVRKIGLTMPGVADGSTYAAAAFRLRDLLGMAHKFVIRKKPA